MVAPEMQIGNKRDAVATQVVRDFPKTIYTPAGGWRAILLIFSVLIGGFSAVGAWYFGTIHDVRSVSATIWLVGICFAFVLLSCTLLSVLFRSRVILTPKSIEFNELFSTGRLSREEILGRRLQQNSHGPASLVLVPRDSAKKHLQFLMFYNFDKTFWDWMGSLPDLDREDQRTAQREMLENSEIGATPEDRMAAVKNAKRLAMFLTVGTYAIGAWGLFYPEPYRLIITLMITLPWLAVVITMGSGGVFRIDSRMRDPHPTVAIPFLTPGCVLAFRAFRDVNILDWRTEIYASVLLAVVLATTTITADHSLRSQKGIALVLIILSIVYGYGASVEANTIFDRGGSTMFRAQIVRKQIVSGEYANDYKLYLAPWGPKRETNHVSVPRRWYESLETGDRICPALHEGALHIRWYNVHPCIKP